MASCESAREALYSKSGALPVEPVKVTGYDFNNGIDYHKLLSSFLTTGFQATNFGLAVNEINRMVCTHAIYSTEHSMDGHFFTSFSYF